MADHPCCSNSMKVVDRPYHLCLSNPTSGFWNLHCRLRIFQADSGLQIVMLTEMGFEIGWFNPSIVEKLVNQIVQEFALDPDNLIWIEYDTSEYQEPGTSDFSQVTFEWQAGKATNPQWKTIAPATVQAMMSKNVQLLAV